MAQYLALDIGGTAIKYGLVRQDLTVLTAQQVPSQAAQGGPALVRQVVALVAEELATAKVAGIALSTAGQVDAAAGIIRYAGPTIPDYSGQNLKQALSAVAQGLPVTVENDVNCALLSEISTEPGCDLMATIGTGIGGAMAMDGQLIHSCNGAMGEFGYFDVAGQPFQAVAATTALVAQVQQLFPVEHIDGRVVFDRCATDDRVAAIVDRYFDDLAAGLKQILMVFPCDRLIIGGGVAENPLFVPTLAARLLPLLPPWLQGQVRVRAAVNGNRAGMLGAVKWHLLNDEKID